jgi:hypothetical protein
MQNLNSYAALLVAIVTLIGSLVAAVKWLVTHYLSELKPDKNGGHNLESRISRIEQKLDTLYNILISK